MKGHQTKIDGLEEVPPMINMAAMLGGYKYGGSIFRSEGSKSVLSGFFPQLVFPTYHKKVGEFQGK